jgi:hypothetical protein
MVSVVATALVNAFAFTGSSFLFRLIGSDAERERHDKAIENLQNDRDQWNEQRLKQLDYVNKKLVEEANSEHQYNNVNDALQEYYYVTGESLELESLGAEPQIEDYVDQETLSALQTGELVFISAGILITGYLLYRG